MTNVNGKTKTSQEAQVSNNLDDFWFFFANYCLLLSFEEKNINYSSLFADMFIGFKITKYGILKGFYISFVIKTGNTLPTYFPRPLINYFNWTIRNPSWIRQDSLSLYINGLLDYLHHLYFLNCWTLKGKLLVMRVALKTFASIDFFVYSLAPGRVCNQRGHTA